MLLYLSRLLSLPNEATTLAEEHDFELAGYIINAEPEDLRPARIVKVATIQNKIVLPTTAPIWEQVTLTYFT